MTMGSPLPSWTKPLTPHTSGILRGIGSTCWIYAAGTGTGKAEFTVAFGEAPAPSQLQAEVQFLEAKAVLQGLF